MQKNKKYSVVSKLQKIHIHKKEKTSKTGAFTKQLNLKNVESIKVEFYSIEGGKVFEKNFNPISNIISFEIPKIASDVYVAKISDRANKIIATKKVIKN